MKLEWKETFGLGAVRYLTLFLGTSIKGEFMITKKTQQEMEIKSADGKETFPSEREAKSKILNEYKEKLTIELKEVEELLTRA